MATLTKTPTKTKTVAQEAAEDYFKSKKILDAIKASDEFKAAEKAMKSAIKVLATEYPAKPDHADAQHPIVVFNNRTETFLHRQDRSIAWKQVVESMRARMTAAQRQELDAEIEFRTKPKVTAKFM